MRELLWMAVAMGLLSMASATSGEPHPQLEAEIALPAFLIGS